ncbi:RHS repeat domain-containing protein [Flavobacterium sp. N1736]|uniref:RHS repeat domain-containing protein n=1 Tax=Flavobacterium sp. N1736 TaxID=2986823 RepID=UPI0022252EC3|nr:RHS repeat domain-containing protein [Flavobacterium sp. N1736]
MTKYHKRHRIIATFFLLIFFPTIFPSDLFASNNGPVAPEATSFEPVDSTDMVNLATGDMSYVLPLLNVPSPEGGYPLSLSYHAGIAMDQEASWVGLGWTLNPGAINRSVKGVPDDWDKTRLSELLYDQGESLDYYNFSIGGTLPNGVTIGMSRSWGAHKAWGGVVGYGGMTANFDTDGNFEMGMGVNAGPFSLNMNSNGGASVGISYGLSSNSGGASLQGSLSYDLNSKSLSTNIKGNAVGISLSSDLKRTSVSYNGSSMTSLSSSASQGDYYQKTSTNGFNINLNGFFWVGYQHTNVKYSLFKLTPNYISGTLNIFDSKNESSYVQDNRSYMDVRSHLVIDKNKRTDYPIANYPLTFVNVVLPNYDNYSVSAQGIFASFSPKIQDELLLYGKGSEVKAPDLVTKTTQFEDELFLTKPVEATDATYKLNNKFFFNLDNVNSSFLRTQTGDFKPLNIPDIESGENTRDGKLVNTILTDTDNTFSSPYNKDGLLTKTGNRKRDGSFIEAFTNKEITEGNTNGMFFEVSGYNRQAYKNIAENGIGAYRVTTIDGKTYHFSLPVYNYEEVYKNYSNNLNENDKFLETVKTKPYATHWLLTAITGPDYVDVNNNNTPDESDYGYWVQFEYGKWSDGYGWKTPKTGAKTYNEKYLYFWGRKEIYYLDKVKTRTHTALFVKSVRNDDKSTPLQYKNGQYASGPMPANITQAFSNKLKKPIEVGSYYDEKPTNTYTLKNYSQQNYRQQTYKYVDLPENLSLKLDKIILVKNSDQLNVAKNLGTGTNRKTGYTYFDYGMQAIAILDGLPDANARKNPYNVIKSDINTDQNILDKDDIAAFNITKGFNIESKAQKVINLGYDYSLGTSLPNASSGRLALRNLEINGKGNNKIIPPYRFNYSKSTTPYNFNGSDVWGYVKDQPDAWSLNEIITPIGTKIKVEYESDSFGKMAAYHTENIKESSPFYVGPKNNVYIPVKYTILNNTVTLNTNDPNFFYNDNLSNIFSLNSEIKLNFSFLQLTNNRYKLKSNDYSTYYTVIGIDDANKKLTLRTNENTNLTLHSSFFEGPFCYTDPANTPGSGVGYIPSITNQNEYAYSFKVVANYNVITGQYGRTGKKGGGIRVHKIATSNFDNSNEMAVEYDYMNPYTNYVSGVTSFEPTDDSKEIDNIQAVEEIPSPEVLYEYVTTSIKNSSQVYSKSIYNFKVMDDITFSDPNLGEFEYKFGNQFNIKFFGGTNRRDNLSDWSYKRYHSDKIIMYDQFSNIGSLISLKNYNGKDQLISKTVNNYKLFDNDSKENGITQESYKNIKRIQSWKIIYDANQNQSWKLDSRYLYTSVSKVVFPNRLESTSTTSGGYTNTTYYDKYDFLTGQVTETTSKSSDGQSHKTRTVPAYLKYADMGSKGDNINNKNMLSQTAAEYSYILNGPNGGAWKETGVGITTWSNVWAYKNIAGSVATPNVIKEKIWRKHKSYIWNGTKDSDGIFTGYVSATDDGFNWDLPSGVGIDVTQASKWKQISEVTLYDHFSAPLEMKDSNGNYASTKMGDNDTKTTVNGNGRYGEMFYCGAENNPFANFPTHLEPEISVTNANQQNSTYFHTGKKSIETTSASMITVSMKNLEHRAGKYKVSVWVEKSNAAKAIIKVDNTAYDFVSDNITAANWQLKTAYLPIPAGACNIYLSSTDATKVYFDDLMIRPVSSSIAGYVYNEWDELTHIIGNNGLATRFEYDAAGRLIRTYIEVIEDPANNVMGGFKLVKSNTYNNKYL